MHAVTTPVLITIPFSHYCEKARWALDRAGVRFEERGYLPFFHAFGALRTGGRRTVPALRTVDGVLADSTDILRWADRRAPPDHGLYGDTPAEEREIVELGRFFDDKLGPDTRRWAYFHILDRTDLMLRLCGDRRAPDWQRRLLFPAMWPAVRAVMRRGMAVTPEGARRSLGRIHAAFDRVGALLSDGRPFLVGARPSAADITFASLAAPVVVPDAPAPAYPGPDDYPPETAALVRTFRAHPAGQLVLRMYREHRR